MSDGDNATPGRPRASDLNGANQWLTRTPRQARAAAPWERRPSAEPDGTDTSPPTGNHTDGVTVADLIAKITGSAPTDHAPTDQRSRHRAAPESEPPAHDPSDPDT